MIRTFTIQPEASDEANEAFNWYEDHQTGLGNEFYRELMRCFEYIAENPTLSRVIYRGLRKRKLERFPYLVIYRVKENELLLCPSFMAAATRAFGKSAKAES